MSEQRSSRTRIPVHVRIERVTDKTPGLGPDGECWECRFTVNTHGYPTVRIPSGDKWSTSNAHRVAWECVYGPINDTDICVCHKCDNRKCVRPSHLFLGSREENNRDRDRKGRTAKGENHRRKKNPELWNSCRGEGNHNAKLNPEKVREIRALYKRGWSQSEIGRKFSVSQPGIGCVLRGVTWKHVL